MRTNTNDGQHPLPSIRKLNAALHYAKAVCIHGSSNKVEDIQKTNGWVCFLKTRYGKPGHYKKWTTMFPLCLITDKTRLKKSNVYIKKIDNSLQYTYINLSKKIITDIINEDEIKNTLKKNDIIKEKELKKLFDESLSINNLNKFSENILNIIFKKNHIYNHDQLTSSERKTNSTINLEDLNTIVQQENLLGSQSIFSLPNKKWYYICDHSTASEETLIKPHCLQQGESPLDKLSTFLKFFFKHAMLSLERRSGNCQDLAILVAKNLWEHAGNDIKRIEIISFENIDHCFVMVNRSGQLNYPKTWGDGVYIIDPWALNGIIFPGANYRKQFKKIIEFINKQHEKLNILFNVNKPIYDITMPSLYSEINIMLQSNPYPLAFPEKIEDYYYLTNAYHTYPLPKSNIQNNDDHIHQLIRNDKKIHQHKFQACLNQMTTQSVDLSYEKDISASILTNRKM